MKPSGDLRLAVELVAMQNQETLAARRVMHPLAMHLKRAVHHRNKRGAIRIVVARNVQQARSGTLFGDKRVHDARVLRGPEESLRETQRIDNVADEHDCFGVNGCEKVREVARPRALETQMGIGKKQGPHARRSGSIEPRHECPSMSATDAQGSWTGMSVA
jgi:hypothetical protein